MKRATKYQNRILSLLGAILLGAFVTVAPIAAVSSASAATAFSQCNSISDTPGLEVACSVTVTNHLNVATGVTSSVTVARVCRGAAGTTSKMACTTRVIDSSQLVGTVSQCNYAGNGGGGNVICRVSIVNDVVGSPARAGVTVDECIGSGGGGGALPLLCDPVQSTTGATVIQCNGSVNGGGAAGRVRCTVSGATTAIRVLVNQCNNSVNGGGSTATCAVAFASYVTPAPVKGASSGGASTGGSGSVHTGGSTATGPAHTAPGGNSGIHSLIPSGPAVGRVSPNQATFVATPAAASNGRLAFTGVDAIPTAVLAALLLLMGAGLALVSRRKARQSL